jgi:hypothetical protein
VLPSDCIAWIDQEGMCTLDDDLRTVPPGAEE